MRERNWELIDTFTVTTYGSTTNHYINDFKCWSDIYIKVSEVSKTWSGLKLITLGCRYYRDSAGNLQTNTISQMLLPTGAVGKYASMVSLADGNVRMNFTSADTSNDGSYGSLKISQNANQKTTNFYRNWFAIPGQYDFGRYNGINYISIPSLWSTAAGHAVFEVYGAGEITLPNPL